MYVSGSPFREYKPLQPVREMRRNEFCWCTSGKKWKRCHAIREHQVQLPLPVLHSKFYNEAKVTGICFHPDAPEKCSGGAIRAHTIQKRTGLLEIAENGHVLSGRNSNPRTNTDDLQLIGINSASTFRGFCSFHDTITFRAAEIINNPTKLAAFLLSYRASCYEIYMKQVALPTLRFLRDNLDAGRSFDEQAEIQQELNAAIFSMKLGFGEHSRLKV
ncbi:SEC-C metal-binding domain-containing protein, partial [Sphingomonas sp. 28-62-11]|uniref:SEC-C metal-binding domain-containing protein n=1 Tax=Sphingomonas sp. 28-62-11 TaxID=1970432 RepID=UPI000BD5E524